MVLSPNGDSEREDIGSGHRIHWLRAQDFHDSSEHQQQSLPRPKISKNSQGQLLTVNSAGVFEAERSLPDYITIM